MKTRRQLLTTPLLAALASAPLLTLTGCETVMAKNRPKSKRPLAQKLKDPFRGL